MKINVNCVVNLGFSLNSGLVKSFDNIGKDFVQYCSHQMNWRSNFFIFFLLSQQSVIKIENIELY